VLVTDFASGFFHWLEDAYGREDFPITGRLVTRPNILHHHNPRYFIRNGWWHSSWDLTCICALIVIAVWLFGHLTWHVWLFAILGSNANQIHKWAHRTPQENGGLVSFLQRCRLIQTSRHHARHHTDPKSSHYCVLTDFLNPILDGLHIWEFFERIVWRVFGIRRRLDISLLPNTPQSTFDPPPNVREMFPARA
jgi:ubiquitin-conjugating enzyme E2 variant